MIHVGDTLQRFLGDTYVKDSSSGQPQPLPSIHSRPFAAELQKYISKTLPIKLSPGGTWQKGVQDMVNCANLISSPFLRQSLPSSHQVSLKAFQVSGPVGLAVFPSP